MKHFLSIVTIICCIVFSGCKNDDSTKSKLNLSANQLSLKSGEVYELLVLPDSDDYVFTSDNSYIATVSAGGIIEGITVGTTDIVVTNESNDFSAKCRVTVEPSYNLYKEPYLKFGASVQEVKSFESRSLLEEDTESLVYRGENSNVLLVMYLFKNEMSTSAGCVVSSSKSKLLGDFLSERYILVEQDGAYLYLVSNDMKTFIIVSVMDSGDFLIAYTKSPDNQTRFGYDNIADKENLMRQSEIMRNLIGNVQ